MNCQNTKEGLLYTDIQTYTELEQIITQQHITKYKIRIKTKNIMFDANKFKAFISKLIQVKNNKLALIGFELYYFDKSNLVTTLKVQFKELISIELCRQ